jgi:hypothetical protein
MKVTENKVNYTMIGMILGVIALIGFGKQFNHNSSSQTLKQPRIYQENMSAMPNSLTFHPSVGIMMLDGRTAGFMSRQLQPNLARE